MAEETGTGTAPAKKTRVRGPKRTVEEVYAAGLTINVFNGKLKVDAIDRLAAKLKELRTAADELGKMEETKRKLTEAHQQNKG